MSLIDESKKIYIVEGMDMTGKTTFVRTAMSGYRIYQANHDLTDITVGRNSSWVIGYGVLDLLRQMGGLSEKVVINRGVFSSYVYPKLYNEENQLPQEVINWYMNDEFFTEQVGHIYVGHSSKESARGIYLASQSREKNANAQSDKYDQFENGFEQYWETYQRAHDLFGEIYGKMWVRPIVVNSVYQEDTAPVFEVKR